MGSCVLAWLTMTTQHPVSRLCLLSIIFLHSANCLFFRPDPQRASREMDMDNMNKPPVEMRGWGWSSWTEWSGACPSVCPPRCRTRERYCSGLCTDGQPVDLSDCPELQSPQPADGENAESPFV